ncbi:hypothetical protein JTE90_013476 [Oedothorax gibbosus]|uniref:exodeoxyribonuclease III n=1 Tax=Oedothorax gibbosus TaxID=931172 RepID=A0AAV6VN64_9ARAC|nr:hypothetical protein JTE90_013476 [Oedothorax gibbosus]
MPPKGRKKVAKSYSAEVDAEFPPIEKILQDKSQPAKSGRGRKKADVADDETIIVGQVDIVEEGAEGGNGIGNGTKMNGGGTPNNQEKVDPFDMLLLDSTTKKDDWRLEFSPDASRMPPKNGAEKESGYLESDEDFKSDSKTSSVVAEAGSTVAKEEIEQVSEEEVEDPEMKDEPEEANKESEKVLEKHSGKKAVEEDPEEEIDESETEEPNVEEEKVQEKRGRKKVVEKAPEEEIEEVEKTEEPEKAVGRRGRKKAEVPEAREEPKKVLAKRGRKKAEVVEEEEEIEDDEPEEEKPVTKRGRKKAEIPEEKDEVDDDEIEEEEKEKPVSKRGRKKLEDVEKEKTEEEPPKSKRGRKKAEVVDIADEESEKEQEKPAPKRGRRKAEVEVVEIADEKSEEEEQEKPKARRGRPAKAVEIEDSPEPKKPRAMRGRKKVEVVDVEASEEKPVSKRGRKKAEVAEVAEEPEKTTGKRGRKRAEVVETETAEEPSKGRKGRKRKGDVPESPNKKGKEAYDEDDISDFAGRELRVAMTRNQEIDEMARKASPPHKEAGNAQKPSDETYVMAKPAKEPTKSGRKRAIQDSTESKPEKIQKEDAKQGKSGAKRAQIPDVSALDFGSDAKTTDDEPWNFKIASWNVNGIRAWLEKGGMSYLKHEDPDVLCIQETKCSEDKLPEELQIAGYHCHWLAGDKEGYSGVGLISKTEPVAITEGIGIEEHDNEGRVITAEYENFYLVNTYVPNSGRGLVRLDYRKTWDKDFRDYLKKLDKKKPVVLCGDLNVAHEEIDIANPKSNKKNAGFTQEERDGFSALLEEGFIDTFRHLYPDEKGAYTFWTYMMNCRAKNVGWRLDYFVISERFKDHLCDSLIRKDVMGSDHCPVGLLLHI